MVLSLVEFLNDTAIRAINTKPVDIIDVGDKLLPYNTFSAEDFEHLLYALFEDKKEQKKKYDKVTLMVTGADQGRDVWLLKDELPVGLVQCKREKKGYDSKKNIKEIIKFILFSYLEPELLPKPEDFTYTLALSSDPASTTIKFFDQPTLWLKKNEPQLEVQIQAVINNYKAFDSLEAKSVVDFVSHTLRKIKYEILRPIDLNKLLHDSPSVKKRFFRMPISSDRESLIEDLSQAMNLVNTVKSKRYAHQQFKACSKQLSNWETSILGKEIERPELSKLVNRIYKYPAGTTLLVGEAGSGKSAILAKLYHEFHCKKYEVLAIKADKLSRTISDLDDLAAELELTGDIADQLIAIASKKPVVLIIDQLDAVSDVMDQYSDRMRVLINLVKKIRNNSKDSSIHIIVSSRPFEAEFDVRFGQLEATEVELELLKKEDVETFLNSFEINTSCIDESLWPSLSVPFILNIFMAIAKGQHDISSFTSINLLETWLIKRLPEGKNYKVYKNCLEFIADEMTSQETLWLSYSDVALEHNEETNQLIAIGILVKDEDRLGFRHQIWLDYFQEKSFEDVDNFFCFVESKQHGLFARSTVLRFIEASRQKHSRQYIEVIQKLLLESKYRFHIKSLVVDFMSSCSVPLEKEVALLNLIIETNFDLGKRVLGRISNNWRVWRERSNLLLSNVLQKTEYRESANWLLTKECSIDLVSSLSLINLYRNTAEYDHEVFQILKRAKVKASLVDVSLLLKKMFNRSCFQNDEIAFYMNDLMKGGDYGSSVLLIQLWVEHLDTKEDLTKPIYKINTLAAKSPLLYSKTFFPYFIQLANKEIVEAFYGKYSISKSLPFDWDWDKGNGTDNILTALRRSLAKVAVSNPEEFQSLIRAFLNIPVDEIHCLFAIALAEGAKENAQFAFDYLMGSEFRLCIGHAHFKDEDDVGYSEYGWYSENLIVKLVPYLNQEQIFNLQSFIEEWTPYPINTESEHPSDRLRWFRRNEEERLKLLSCLPTTHFKARRLRQVREFKRNQKARIGKPNSIGMATPVSSPMSSDAMNKASDEQLLKMLNTVNDIVDNRSSMARFLGGGQSQLNSAFGRFSMDNPQRAIALIRDHFEVGKNEKAAGEAISQLSESESVNSLRIKDLIFELDARGFTNESFRQDASRALNKLLLNKALTLTVEEIAVVKGWLKRESSVLRNQYLKSEELRKTNIKQNKKPKDKPQAKLFHNGHGIRFVKQYNYSYLRTLMFTYLCRDIPDYEGWLTELENHLRYDEDPSIWGYLLISDSGYLVNIQSQRVKKFLSEVFRKYPEILTDPDIVTVLWNLRDYLDDKFLESVISNWFNSDDELLLQVSGELTSALAVTAGNQFIDITLNQFKENRYYNVCGILFSATTAWKENYPTIRERAHSLLVEFSKATSRECAFAFVKSIESSSLLKPDNKTIEMIQLIKSDSNLLGCSAGYWTIKSIESLVLYPNAELTVLEFIESYIDLVLKSDSRNSARNTENLVNILISLQRSSRDIQKRAMSAYEKLLSIRDFEAEKAIESSMRM